MMMNDHKLLSRSTHPHDRGRVNKSKITSWFAHFHRTQFTDYTTGHLLLWLIVLYAYFSVMLVAMSIVNRLTGITLPKGSATLINFMFVEVFPLALLTSFFSQYHHWVRRWSRIFWQDLRRNWSMIFGSGMMLFVIQIALSNLLMFVSRTIPASRNTTEVLADTKQNSGIWIMAILIAPIFEELVFRFFLTNISSQIINKVLRIPKWSDRLGILISAFCFAILHDGFDWMHIVIYMGCALFLQFIQRKTRSLTAPVLVHGTANLIVTTLALI